MSQSPAKAYKYQALPCDSFFRVLELLPGGEYDPVIGTMHIVDWSTVPNYEAISYCWGDKNDTMPVHIDGRTVWVTKSLQSGLTHLRYRDRSRWLWADAVCINQGDIPERSQQVNMMRKIYERARSVLIWLEPENADAPGMVMFAIDAVEKISAFICEKLSISPDDLQSEDNIYLQILTSKRHLLPVPDQSPFNSDEVWRALLWLYTHPYFTRCLSFPPVPPLSIFPSRPLTPTRFRVLSLPPPIYFHLQ